VADNCCWSGSDGVLRGPMKAQPIRLVDVFLLGPFMMWAGAKMVKTEGQLAGWAMLLSGVGTILYNGKNYLEIAGESNE